MEELGDSIPERDRRAAARTMRRIVEATTRLANHPQIGRPGRIPGTRELVVSGTRYIVPYRIAADRCELLAVFHSAREWPERFD